MKRAAQVIFYFKRGGGVYNGIRYLPKGVKITVCFLYVLNDDKVKNEF